MSDWHPDSDDTEPELLAAYSELRESRPVAHSDAYGGFIPLSLNGEDHLFFRRLLARYFTGARLRALEPRIRAMVVEHLTALPARTRLLAYASASQRRRGTRARFGRL